MLIQDIQGLIRNIPRKNNFPKVMSLQSTVWTTVWNGMKNGENGGHSNLTETKCEQEWGKASDD